MGMKSVLIASGFTLLLAFSVVEGKAQQVYLPTPAETASPAPAPANTAQSQPFTGSFGPSTNSPVPSGLDTTGATMTPGMERVLATAQKPAPAVTSPVAPAAVAATVPETAAPLPSDPCATYMTSYELYAFCQDRIKKLDRMKKAGDKRSDNAKAYYARQKERRNPTPKTPEAKAGAPIPTAPDGTPDAAAVTAADAAAVKAAQDENNQEKK